MNKKWTAALVGAGRIGFSLGFDRKREQPASHTMALLQNKKIDLAAACDTSEENLKNWRKYAKKHGSKGLTYSNSDELYRSKEKFDIIVVAVNEDAHFCECKKAVEYRPRLVILEKPVALNCVEGRKLEKLAEEYGVPVMVNHERRFDRNYLLAEKLLEKIGVIQSVTGELDSGLRVWGEEFENDGTYSLLHDGTHLVDILRFLLKAELKNPRVESVFFDEKGIVRNFTAIFKTEKINEIIVRMSGRSRFFEFRVEITGTLGKICVGNGFFDFYLREESPLYTGFYSLKKQKIRVPKKSRYFSGMVENAVEFLEGKSALLSPLSEALEDLKVLESIKEQFRPVE